MPLPVVCNPIWSDECIVVSGSTRSWRFGTDYHGPGFAFGFHFLWLVGLFLVFMAGAVALVIWAIQESRRPAHPVASGVPMPKAWEAAAGMPPAAVRETPLEILARRFASGEINADEYQHARDLLGGSGKT